MKRAAIMRPSRGAPGYEASTRGIITVIDEKVAIECDTVAITSRRKPIARGLIAC